MKIKYKAIIASACFAVTACGGSSSSGGSKDKPTINTGIFLDSPVANIAYRTQTLSGFTDSEGQYEYLSGETVTFSIGGIDLPSALAAGVVTPLDLVGTNDVNDTQVANIARLLQSIDSNDDPSDGISIADLAHETAEAMTIDFTAASFDSDVLNLVANSGSTNTDLVDATTAISHLEESVNEDRAPDMLTKQWLAGRTVYDVWFGNIGAEESGAGMARIEFHTNGTATWTSLYGDQSEPDTIPFDVDAEGNLGFVSTVSTASMFTKNCGSTSDYLEILYTEDGEFDNTDRFYFDQEIALAAAQGLSEQIPLPDCSDTSNNPTEFSTDWLAGKTLYDVGYEEESEADAVSMNKLEFNSDATSVRIVPITNATFNGSAAVNVIDSSVFFGPDDDSVQFTINTCGGSEDHIEIAFLDIHSEVPIEYTGHWYFSRIKAVLAAADVTEEIPTTPCF